MNILWCILSPFAGLASTTASPAAPSRWSGDWQLDRAASTLRGDIISIRKTPDGYLFDFGAVAFTLPDDGAFHPTIAGRETRLIKLGALRWAREHRNNGQVADRSILTVARDGGTLTIADAHAVAPPEVLDRIGRGTGLAGRWRSTRLGANVAETFSLVDAGDGRLRWGSPSDGNYYLVGIGAEPAVNQGPNATASATLQVVAVGENLRWIERLAGKPYRIGEDRLSAGGSILTEVAWPAASPHERQVLIYHRPTRL